jgi:glycerophosphoryl diester phosphodiesterase
MLSRRMARAITLGPMEIIAHRGASHDAPENTLAAVRLAWEQAADAVEVDVQLTRDGRLAVIHDSDTQRTGGVAWSVAASSLAELQALDVGCWKDRRFAGERIPALEEVIALVPPGRRLFVELKGGPELVPPLERCLAARRPSAPPLAPGQVAIITFDLRGAEAAKRVLPRHEVCWLAEAGAGAPCASVADVAATARTAGLDGIDLDAGWRLDREILQQIRRNGFKVYVWTVDDATVAQTLAAIGIDGLTTNRPGWMRGQIPRG